MTAPVSTVPTFLAWFVARLKTQVTAVTGHSLHVDYGPDGVGKADDIVRVESGTRNIEFAAMVGDMSAHSLYESYEVLTTVSVYRGGADFLAAETRAWALLAIVEEVVRTDAFAAVKAGTAVATFGGNVFRVAIDPHAAQADWAAGKKGPLIEITYPLTVHASI